MQRLDFRAMGCQMLALADTDDARTTEMLASVPEWFENWEASLSRFRDDSELSLLNQHAGQAFRVSETMWQVLEKSFDAARASDNLVTPAVLDAVRASGYDTSFELMRDDNSAPQFAPVNDWHAIQVDALTRTVCLPRGMHLDFGGVAKGWSADQAALKMRAYSPTMIDAGGDVAISGPRANDEPWYISVADPFDAKADIAGIAVFSGGVATSGRDYRKWQRNGATQHHIIDPRTGRPAETDVLTATVIAPSASEAEIAAKVALILGGAAGLKWLNERAQFAGMIVLDDGRTLTSARWSEYALSDSQVEEMTGAI